MRIVRLERVNHLVRALPGSDCVDAHGVYSLLGSALKYTRRVDTPGQRSRKPEWQEFMLVEQAHGVSYFPVGLLPRTVDLLNQSKVSVQLVHVKRPKIPKPDLTRVTPCKDPARADDQRLVLANVFTKDFGIIKAPTGFGKTFCIEEIVMAYPTLTIVICTRRKDVMRSIYDRISKKLLTSELGIVGDGFNNPNRVTICTSKSIKKTPYAACDLLLYDEVHEAAAPETSKTIAAFTTARRFGFSASPFGRSDGADRLTEAMFGPVICDIQYQEAQAKGAVAKIDVHAYAVPGSTISCEDITSQYRHGIWRNDLRNRIIVATASQHALQGKQTLILVDKIEHALRIRKYLPQWPVIYGNMTEEKRLMFVKWGLMKSDEKRLSPDKRDEYRRLFEGGKLRYAIATGVWNTGVDFRHLDVLARGDGTSGAISNTQTPGRLSRGKYGLLLDYSDGFDTRFAYRWEKRRASYKGKGWNILPMHAPAEALQMV